MERVIGSARTKTVVRNLASADRSEFRIYTLDPKEAVVTAYEQSKGNHNTWGYPCFEDHPESFDGDSSVACGDFAAHKDLAATDVMRRFPRIVAHIIAESLGYATPTCAARILLNAIQNEENGCEWVYTCYGCDAGKCAEASIRNRHGHKGYMAEFKLARALVDRALETGSEPELASWF